MFADKDIPTSEKKLFQSSHFFGHPVSSKSLLFWCDFFKLVLFHSQIPCLFIIMIAVLKCMFIKDVNFQTETWLKCMFIRDVVET